MRQKKKILAPIGPQGCGKEYFAGTVRQYCGARRVSVHSTGGIVRSIAKILHLEPCRSTCNDLVRGIAKEFGDDFLAKAIEQNIIEDPHDIIVYDCPRRLEDMEMIQRLREQFEVWTIYLIRSPEDRFEGLKKRARPGEVQLDWDGFMAQENLEQEKYIRQIGEAADFRLRCFGGPEQLDQQKLAWCYEHLPEYAKIQ